MTEMIEEFINYHINRGDDLNWIEGALKVSVEMTVSDWADENGWEMRNGKWVKRVIAADRAADGKVRL